MRVWSIALLAGLSFGIADAVTSDKGHAEQRVRRVALKAGEKIYYDGANMKVTNSRDANDLLKREYRRGWSL